MFPYLLSALVFLSVSTMTITRQGRTRFVLDNPAYFGKVVFSLTKLNSSFTERLVIFAVEMEGAPTPQGKGPFRLVVPGERNLQEVHW